MEPRHDRSRRRRDRRRHRDPTRAAGAQPRAAGARRRAHRRIHARGDWHRGRVRRRVAGSLSRQRLPDATDPCGGRSRGRGPRSLQHLAGPQARATGRPSPARGLPSFPREINRIRRGNGGRALGVRRGRASVRRPDLSTGRAGAARERGVVAAGRARGRIRGTRRGRPGSCREGAGEDRAHAGVRRSGVRLPAAEPPREREPRESRSVRHAFPCGAAVRVDGGSEGQDQRSDGRAGPRESGSCLRRTRERTERAGARRPRDARTGAHGCLRSVMVDGRLADRHRLRELRRHLDSRVPDARRLRECRDAVLGAPVTALARPRQGGTAARADVVPGDRGAMCAVSRRRAAEGLAVRREPGRVDEPGRFRRSRNAGPDRRRDRLRDLDRHPALQQMEGAGSLRRPSRCRPFVGRPLQRHLGVGRPRGERARTDPLRHDHALRRRCRGVRPRAGNPGARLALRTGGTPSNRAEKHAVDAHDVVLPGPRRHEERGQRRPRGLRGKGPRLPS